MSGNKQGIYEEITYKISEVKGKRDIYAIWEVLCDEKQSLSPYVRFELRKTLDNKSLQKFGITTKEIVMEIM
jgi:hypothetical protein